MDVKLILEYLKTCVEILSVKFVEAADKKEQAYAIQYALIMVGERVNAVIDEIADYVLKNESLFKDLSKQVAQAWEENRLKTENDKNNFFREAFNKTPVGQSLLVLNEIRNGLKHRFEILTENDYQQFIQLSGKFDQIIEVLNHVKKMCQINKEHDTLVKCFFAESYQPKKNRTEKLASIKTGLIEIDLIVALVGKQSKKKEEIDIVSQKQNVLTLLESMHTQVELMQRYTNKLESNTPNKICPMYATAMCLIKIGIQAKELNSFIKKYDASIANLIKEHKTQLNKLYKTTDKISHATRQLETISVITNSKKFQAIFTPIYNVYKFIEDLSITTSMQSSNTNLQQATSYEKPVAKPAAKKEDVFEKKLTTEKSTAELLTSMPSPAQPSLEKRKEKKAKQNKRKLEQEKSQGATGLQPEAQSQESEQEERHKDKKRRIISNTLAKK